MENPYQKEFFASWGDMDFNSHMRNTAYLDKSADTRMMFFSENGFPMSEFMRIKVGPVIVKDEIEYYQEITLLEKLKVTLSLLGLSKDGSCWQMRNEFFSASGKLLARVSSSGVWLDLTERRTVSAPVKLLDLLHSLSKSEDFKELQSKTGK